MTTPDGEWKIVNGHGCSSSCRTAGLERPAQSVSAGGGARLRGRRPTGRGTATGWSSTAGPPSAAGRNAAASRPAAAAAGRVAARRGGRGVDRHIEGRGVALEIAGEPAHLVHPTV